MDYRLGSNPCKGCKPEDGRSGTCHVTCEKYLEWQELRITYLNERNKKLQNDIRITAGQRKCHRDNIKKQLNKRTRKRSRH